MSVIPHGIDKKRLLITVILVIVLIAISIIMAISAQNNRFDYKNNSYIFGTVNDLSFIDEYVVEENIQLDKHIFNTYESCLSEYKTVHLDYNGKKINVFAYTFTDTDFCLDYVKDVTGSNYKSLNNGNIASYYYKHTSFFNIYQSEKLVVFQNNKCYAISAKMSQDDFNQFVEYFMNNLPVKLEMTY